MTARREHDAVGLGVVGLSANREHALGGRAVVVHVEEAVSAANPLGTNGLGRLVDAVPRRALGVPANGVKPVTLVGRGGVVVGSHSCVRVEEPEERHRVICGRAVPCRSLGVPAEAYEVVALLGGGGVVVIAAVGVVQTVDRRVALRVVRRLPGNAFVVPAYARGALDLVPCGGIEVLARVSVVEAVDVVVRELRGSRSGSCLGGSLCGSGGRDGRGLAGCGHVLGGRRVGCSGCLGRRGVGLRVGAVLGLALRLRLSALLAGLGLVSRDRGLLSDLGICLLAGLGAGLLGCLLLVRRRSCLGDNHLLLRSGACCLGLLCCQSGGRCNAQACDNRACGNSGS